ncbi:hypothetical protein FD723_40340 (plasmid) [Nostoc sp. C052]|nr:hypothetical protein FD723_40340 [Nostoc sp. C052]
MNDIGELYNSGDRLVDAIAQINFQGNLIPKSWFSHVKYTNTRGEYCDYLAVNILSEVVYWYRPKVIKGARGKVLGVCKRFSGDKLRRSYESFATQFNATIKQVKSSIRLLKSLKLIESELRTIEIDGRKIPNILYVSCNPSKIAEITKYRTQKGSSSHPAETSNISETEHTHSPNRQQDIADLGYTLITQNPLAASFLIEKGERQITKENTLENTLSPKPSLSLGEEPEERVEKVENQEQKKKMKPILRNEQPIKNPPLQQSQAFHAGYGVPEVKVITSSGEIITQTYTPIHAAKRPARAQLKYTYPDGPWLVNGCINQDFIRDRANLWRTGDSPKSIAFGKMPIEEVDALVQGFYMSDPVKLELHWGAYVKKNERYLSNVSLRAEAGIAIPEAEQQQILPKMYAVMQERIPEFCADPVAVMPPAKSFLQLLPQKMLAIQSGEVEAENPEIVSPITVEAENPEIASPTPVDSANPEIASPTPVDLANEQVAIPAFAVEISEQQGVEKIKNQIDAIAQKKSLRKAPKFEVDTQTELAKLNSWLSDPILCKEAVRIAKNRGYEITYSSYGHPDSIQLPPKPVRVVESVTPEKLDYPVFESNSDTLKYFQNLQPKQTAVQKLQKDIELEINALNTWLSDPNFYPKIVEIVELRGYEIVCDASGAPILVKDIDF